MIGTAQANSKVLVAAWRRANGSSFFDEDSAFQSCSGRRLAPESGFVDSEGDLVCSLWNSAGGMEEDMNQEDPI